MFHVKILTSTVIIIFFFSSRHLGKAECSPRLLYDAHSRMAQCCELVGIFPYCGKIEDPWEKGNFGKNMGISGNGTLYLVDLL